MIFTKTSKGNFTKAQPRTEPCRYHSLGFGHDQGNQKVIRNTFDIMLSIGYKARDETFSPRSAVNTSIGPLGCEWNALLTENVSSPQTCESSRASQISRLERFQVEFSRFFFISAVEIVKIFRRRYGPF